MTQVGPFLLTVAVVSIAWGAWRVAGRLLTDRTDRAVAAAVLGAATIVVETLVLGLVGLGTNPGVLCGAAVATTALVGRLVPAGEPAPVPRTPWPPGARAGAGAALGVGLGWLGWVWKHPFVGFDGMLQNLLEIGIWIHDGRPGTSNRVFALAPIEAFPLTNDVLVTWLAAMGRSFAVVAVWQLACLALLTTALASILRHLRVPTPVAIAAVVSLVSITHVLAQLNAPKTDLAALAWLACCVALGLRSEGDTRVLGLALVAGGLSVGSKTTTAPLVVFAVAATFWPHRRALRARPVAAFVGFDTATAVGGLWYLRNLLQHGSPFFPFLSLPWGDDLPLLFQVAGDRFIEAPRTTLDQQFGGYTKTLAGGMLVLLAAAVVTAIGGRRKEDRAALVALVGALFGGLFWIVTPVSGISNLPLVEDPLTSTTRYLVPVVAAAALALAVVGRRSVARLPVLVVFAVATLWNLVAAVAHVGEPLVPPPALVAGVAAVGAVAGLLAARVPRPVPTRAVGAVVAVASVLAAVALVAAGDGWAARQRQELLFGGAPVQAMLDDPRFREGHEPIYVTNIAYSQLGGEHIGHAIHLLPDRVPCDELEALIGHAWVVLIDNQFDPLPPDRPRARECLVGVEPMATDEAIAVYDPA